MSVDFSSIPNDVVVPFMHVEFDGSAAAEPQDGANPTLILGHMFPATHSEVVAARAIAGTAAENTLYPIGPAAQGDTLFGPESILAEMIRAYRQIDPFGELYALAVPEAAGATQETWEVDFDVSVATEDGELALYINGRKISVPVATGDTASDMASALAAAINAEELLGVYASAPAALLTLTSKHKGLVGKGYDVRFNLLGAAAGERYPAGVAIAGGWGDSGVAYLGTGTTWPDLTATIAAVGDEVFDVIINPWWGGSSGEPVAQLKTELDSRWGWSRSIDGHAIDANFITRHDAGGGFGAHGSAYAQMLAQGEARNDAHATGIGLFDSPTPPWIWAAQWGANAARYLAADPSLPLQTLGLPGVLPPPKSSAGRFTLAERNALLKKGVATWLVQGGQVRIEQSITTYQKNALGVSDVTWRHINVPFLLMRIKRYLRSLVSLKFPRARLVDDSDAVRPTSGKVVTEKIMRGEMLAAGREFEERGWIEDYEAFAEALVVARSKTNRDRLDIGFKPDLANQLRIVAMLIQFRV